MMEETKTYQKCNIRIIHSSCESLKASPKRISRKRKLVDVPCHDLCHQTIQTPEPLEMSPSLYLSAALRNKGIPSRISHLSLDQALYFEPYRESQFSADIVRALRSNGNLEGLAVEELRKQRNSFGESLMHLVCRLGLASAKFLVEEAKVPMNVRDKFGRSPLHNACLAAIPNFATVRLILKHAPKLVLFEDNKGRTPFDYISARNRSKWSRFLSEDGILKQLQSKLRLETLKKDGKNTPKFGKNGALRLSQSALLGNGYTMQTPKKKIIPPPPQNPSVIDAEVEPNQPIMKLFSRKPISFAPAS